MNIPLSIRWLNIYALALALVLFLAASQAHSHDSWISRGGFKSSANEWCCGAGDCAVMDPKTVGTISGGYRVSGWGTIDHRRREFYHEFVPAHEAQPSPDGAYWRCKRPDGSRRCWFAPPPGS